MQAPEGSGVQWTRGFGEGAREWESEGQLGSLDCCEPVTLKADVRHHQTLWLFSNAGTGVTRKRTE